MAIVRCESTGHAARHVGAADADDAKRIELHDVLARGREVTAQAHFTEVAHQADGRTALEELAGGAGVAGVGQHIGFQPEAGLQAAAQILDAAKAQATRGQAAAVHADIAGQIAVLHIAHVGIDDTEQGDRRLGICAGADENGGQCGGIGVAKFHFGVLGLSG
ncbi:hypothetical protein D3C85_1409150 [compost metagenome]